MDLRRESSEAAAEPRRGASVVALELRRGTDGYPAALLQLKHPPEPLYCLGDPRILTAAPDRTVAIVGTREASPYGVRVASELAAAFAEAEVTVVSGLARGIDSAAHRGALRAGGRTVAVLGTGIDVPYPASNRALHAEIAARGLVLSENEPGTPAGPGCFPRRNRIIAALAKVTVVVEAGYKSGAINTATQAMELGRTVAAVPGPIDSPNSAGANLLLRDGAHVIAGIADALSLFGVSRNEAATPLQLSEGEARIWSELGKGAASVDALSDGTGLSIRQVLESVALLEMKGLAEQLTSGEVRRRTLG